MGCLYKLTSPSGKSYIGITSKTLDERWAGHVRRSQEDRCYCAISAAIKKYGQEAFRKEVLIESSDWSELCILEKRAIAEYGTLFPVGYNLTIGGEGVLGPKTERAKRVHAEAQRKRYQNPDQRAQLLRNAALGGRAGNAARWTGHINAWPRPRVGETVRRERIRSAMARPETKEKLSAAQRGKLFSIETRNKLSRAHTGKKLGPASESRKNKIRDAQLRSWSDPDRRTKRLAGMAAARMRAQATNSTKEP